MRKDKSLHVTSFSLLTFLVFLSSFFFCSCPNPLVIRILDPKTVSFVTNGGSYVKSQTVYRDYPIKRPPNPVMSGYTFDAWYIDNDTFHVKWDFNTAPNADITLYASWIEGVDRGGGVHTVTFDFNGVGTARTRKVFHGSAITAPADHPTYPYTTTQGLYLNPVPTAHTLDGWLTADGDLWNFSNDTVIEDITLYANWTIPNRIEISGNVNMVETAIALVKENAAADRSFTLLRSDINIQVVPQTIDVPNFNLTIKGISGSSFIGYNGDATSSLFTINANDAKLTLEGNITLEGKASTVDLITVTNGTLVMETGSTITGHSGRAVHVNGGTFNMNDGTKITLNSGGGVRVNSGEFNMNGGTISNNGNSESLDYGGGVYVNGGTFTMSGNEAKISGNTARYCGGGVYISNGGEFNMNNGEITENNNANSGGGVYSNGIFKMIGGEISGNTAVPLYIAGSYSGGSGGGVSVGGGTFTINNGGTISGNTASFGGGVYTNSSFIMNGGIINGNRATDSSGGGIYVGSDGTFRISNGTVYGTDHSNTNISQGRGAALYVTTDYGYDGTAIYGDSSPVETTPTGDGSGNYRDTTINGHN